MPVLAPDHWSEIFVPQAPLLELIARGSLLYVAIVLLMRFMLRRSSGELERMDLVFLLLLSEAAQPAFGEYRSLADSLVVIVTLMVWNYLLNALSYHVPFVERLLTPSALLIVRNGRMLRRRMRREYITEEELMRSLREEGIEHLKDVRAAYVESDGAISVVDRRK